MTLTQKKRLCDQIGEKVLELNKLLAKLAGVGIDGFIGVAHDVDSVALDTHSGKIMVTALLQDSKPLLDIDRDTGEIFGEE